MGELLIVLAIVALAAGVIVFLVARTRPKQPKQPSARQDPLRFASETATFGPRQLGPGAIVSYGGTDYVVRGSVTLREGPFVWWEHLLEGKADEPPVWFSVEEDEGRLELVWWHKRAGLPAEPGSSIDVDGVSFTVDENGRASSPPRAPPACPRAATWTTWTTAPTATPRCWATNAGRPPWHGRSPMARRCAPAS